MIPAGAIRALAIGLLIWAGGCSEPPAKPPTLAAPAHPPPNRPKPAGTPRPQSPAEPEQATELQSEPVRFPDGTTAAPCREPAPPGMACIPGGPFVRGTDDGNDNTRPAETVYLHTFYMDVDEVTYEDYKACVKARNCNRAGPAYTDFDRPRQPINGIDWFDAVKFCKAMGKHLPTEAQWEKAARGPDGHLYPWGDEPSTCERAIIKDDRGRSCGVKKAGDKPNTGRPWEVGSRPPGVYGLRDMMGNSWEWVHDWYARSYELCAEPCRGVDPNGPCHGAEACPGHNRKVVRGGSWYWDATYATGVHRRSHVPNNHPFHHFGFRCAATDAEAAALAADEPAG